MCLYLISSNKRRGHTEFEIISVESLLNAVALIEIINLNLCEACEGMETGCSVKGFFRPKKPEFRL